MGFFTLTPFKILQHDTDTLSAPAEHWVSRHPCVYWHSILGH